MEEEHWTFDRERVVAWVAKRRIFLEKFLYKPLEVRHWVLVAQTEERPLQRVKSVLNHCRQPSEFIRNCIRPTYRTQIQECEQALALQMLFWLQEPAREEAEEQLPWDWDLEVEKEQVEVDPC